MRLRLCLLTGLAAALALSGIPAVVPGASAIISRLAEPASTVLASDLSSILASAQVGQHDIRAVAIDIDHDGDTDIVSSTVEEPLIVWINDGQGHFTQRRSAGRTGLASAPDGVFAPFGPAGSPAVPPTSSSLGAPLDNRILIAPVLPAGPVPPLVQPPLPGGTTSSRASRAPPFAPTFA
jgi:hypothetical protein